MRVCYQTARNARATGGFTLIEVMVVIVILGLLATMVAQNVVGNAERARAEKASVDCKQIADAARMFFVDKGRIPSLEELVTPDAKGMRYLESVPEDPWGTGYALSAGELRGEIEVRSAGPDRTDPSEDDISSKPKAK